MPPDDAEKCDPPNSAWANGTILSKSRANRVSLSGQTLRGIAVIHPEIAGHAEPIVGVDSDRAAAAVHPDGVAPKNIKEENISPRHQLRERPAHVKT
jgi:hypothetical protein